MENMGILHDVHAYLCHNLSTLTSMQVCVQHVAIDAKAHAHVNQQRLGSRANESAAHGVATLSSHAILLRIGYFCAS